VPRFPSYVGMREDVELAAPPSAAPAPVAFPAPGKSGEPSRTFPSASPSEKHYFEFIAGSSSKFWEVSVEGSEMSTRWGRIGSAGQSKTKSFPDEATARTTADKLIAEKSADGYVEKAGS
jgi:DNA ligase-1